MTFFQRGYGATVRLRELRQLVLCPVQALRGFLKFRGLGPGLLFQHKDGFSLTLVQFRAKLQRVLRRLGLNVEEFGLHSSMGRFGSCHIGIAGHGHSTYWEVEVCGL